MVRLALPILALALGATAAVALASCGRDDKGLLPGDSASQIVANLNTVQELVRAGDCSSAASAVSGIQEEIRNLPDRVNPQLRARLTEGAQRLALVVNSPAACETTSPETTPTEPTTESTTTETTTKKEKPKKPEKPETTAPTTTTEPTTTTTGPPGPPTGGTPGDSGDLPPGQEKKAHDKGKGPGRAKRKDKD
jgi:hypothetical protein